MYTQTEKVNIEPKSYLPVFRISQNDIGRTLKAHLVSDEGTIAIPAGATVTMAGIKPSGLGYTVTGTINGSDVTFETDATMTDEAGQIESEIRIVDGETLIGTTNVVLNVEPNPHPDDTTDGQREPLVNEITALLNQITAQADRTEEYSSKVLNMTVTAHESQEPTVTKTEGEVVNLDFGLPKGEQGERGERGERGEAGKDGKDGIDGKDGKDGINGVTPDFSIGTVTTLEPTESASVTLTGTEEEPVLNFGIPRGEKGEQGEVSLNDLKKIMVTDSASGSIASFPDGSDLLPALSLIANIVPKQSGSGTPSPDNVRPISGWESVETSVCGVNHIDATKFIKGRVDNGVIGYESNVTELVTTENSVKFTTNNPYRGVCSGKTPVVPNTSYCLIYDRNDDVAPYLDCYDTNDNWLGRSLSSDKSTNEKAIRVYTTKENTAYIRCSFQKTLAGETTINNISINYPSTDHDYHAYTGTTHTTDLGRTVYGGTVDVVRGTLTVTHALVTLDGTQPIAIPNWRPKDNSVGWVYPISLIDVKKVRNSINWISDKLQSVTYDTIYGNDVASVAVPPPDVNYALVVRVTNNTLTTESAINAYLAQNPITICYELATPQTYTLTPQTINTLAGVNNVWVDSGDCSITYYADTKLYIDKKLGGN